MPHMGQQRSVKVDLTRQTTVPLRKGRDLPKPVVGAILEQATLTIDEFQVLL